MKSIRPLRIATWALAALWLALPADARAFCGFYVGKADAGLYNEASQVVVARKDTRTVISMMNDYRGELTEFALVVPVPVVLEKGQIRVGDRKLFERIDAFTAPRLVEYFDPDPCQVAMWERSSADRALPMAAQKSGAREMAKSLGVTIEAEYTVGEYDIVILSAKESNGLETWLRESGYRIPAEASRALRPYVRQEMKFFVARVNLEEQAKTGLRFLRPLQFAFDTDRFMLPVRLGMLNARGPQDLIVYVLTAGGRVETTNYRSIELPTGMDLPVHVKSEFPEFYRAMFAEQVKSERAAVFTEYFWNMSWCDPCAAEPLTPEELRGLGVFWVGDAARRPLWPGTTVPAGPLPVMVTRLHVRTTPEAFPEDLVFQETKDQENYQARYVLRHAWSGASGECPAAEAYLRRLPARQEQEARTLARLTGWSLEDVRRKMGIDSAATPKTWWEELFGAGS